MIGDSAEHRPDARRLFPGMVNHLTEIDAAVAHQVQNPPDGLFGFEVAQTVGVAEHFNKSGVGGPQVGARGTPGEHADPLKASAARAMTRRNSNLQDDRHLFGEAEAAGRRYPCEVNRWHAESAKDQRGRVGSEFTERLASGK